MVIKMQRSEMVLMRILQYLSNNFPKSTNFKVLRDTMTKKGGFLKPTLMTEKEFNSGWKYIIKNKLVDNMGDKK